jgi:integrase
VKTAWHNALRLAGLPRFPIYQCRHTYATRLAAAGVSDTVIDQLLGHSRRNVLRFYTARVPEYLRDAINLLDKLRGAKTDLSGGPKIEDTEGLSTGGPALVN